MLFDYSIADIKDRKTYLNEVEIFHRIFIEQVFTVLKREQKDFFDKLSLRDILQLRSKIEESSFVEKYNELINKSVKLVQKNDYIDLYSIREIIELSEYIKKNFYDEIKKESERYVNSKIKNNINTNIIMPSAKLVISNLPVVGNIINNTSELSKILISSINQITFNLDIKNLNAQKKLFKMQQEVAKDIINKLSIESQIELIETLKLLKNFFDEKYENF